eukprot:3878-Heterococcus_DN1.PRE.2
MVCMLAGVCRAAACLLLHKLAIHFISGHHLGCSQLYGISVQRFFVQRPRSLRVPAKLLRAVAKQNREGQASMPPKFVDQLAPRLSSHLRSLQGAAVFDLDAQLLRRHRAVTQIAQPAASSITWREFAAGLDTSDGAAAKAARDKLSEFVRLSGDLSENGVFAEADRVLYTALTAGNASAKQAHTELAAVVGHVDADKWKRLVALAKDLADWKSARQLEKEKERTAKQKAAAAAASTTAVQPVQEWGLNLGIDAVVRPPADSDTAELQALLTAAASISSSSSASGTTASSSAASAATAVSSGGLSRHAQQQQQQQQQQQAPPAGVVGAQWLCARCEQHCRLSGAVLPPVDLAASLLAAIAQHRGDAAALQGPLFDLLGEAGIELMMEVLTHAEALSAVDLLDVEAAAAAGAAAAAAGGTAGAALRRMPPPAPRAGPR